jgi:serine/threonine protein kinase
MGEVWMAEQQQPVRRRVALKLVRSDSPTKEIIARFEAERQALAMMDHPNIAKVLDVGQTEGGQPYFVMDLVQGVPITDYCDRNRLTPRERLELFVSVCQAIQHAHQKGIIHRDIKPSNVLVTLYDGKPVAKVIDFGLAKALQTQTRLTDKTLFTEFGRVVGTLRYMSPEQAEMNALDVDTRTDVYSLGVMLYELLTGSTPLDQETIKQKALLAVLQMIREQEPPRPSKRLIDSGEAVSGISAQRRIEPAQLSRILKGDLDWVVMKALEKDRARRYETAASLADDVRRYLDNEPVQARPPSIGYRFGKFARKHRAAVLATIAIFASLVIGIIVTSSLTVWAVSEQSRANAATAEVNKEKSNVLHQKARAEIAFAQADKARAEALAALEKTMDALRSATDDVVEKLIGSKEAITSNERAYLESALKRWQSLADEHDDSVIARRMRFEGALRVAILQTKLGDRQAALANYRKSIKIGRRLVEQFPRVAEYQDYLALSHHNLGVVLDELEDRDEARAAFEACRAIRKKLVEQFPSVSRYQQVLVTSHGSLGVLLRDLRDYATARAALEEGLAIAKKLVEQHPAVPEYQEALARSHINLGNLLRDLRDYDAARTAFDAGITIRKKLVEQHAAEPEYQSELAGSHNDLGNLLSNTGDQEAARVAYEAGLAIQKKLTEQYPAMPEYKKDLASIHNNLGNSLKHLGDQGAARAAHEASLAIRKKLVEQFPAVPEYQSELAQSHINLGNLLNDFDDQDAARAAYEAGIAIQKKLVKQVPTVPEYQEALASSHVHLGNLLQSLRNYDAARAEYEAVLTIGKKLVEQFPAEPEYQGKLARSYNSLGILLSDFEDHAAARAAYEDGIAILKNLVEQFPAVPAYQVELGGSYCNLGALVSQTGKPAESLELFDMAVQVLKAVHDREPRDVMAKQFLRNSHQGRALANDLLLRHAEAVMDWDQVVELSAPAEKPDFRAIRAVSQVRAGMVAEAVAAVAELAQHPNWPAGQWCNFARIYSIGSTEFPNKQLEHADRAMELLRKAVEAGYKNAERLKTDPNFGPLHDREDFKQLVAELEAVAALKPMRRRQLMQLLQSCVWWIAPNTQGSGCAATLG